MNSSGPIISIVESYIPGGFKRSGKNIIARCPFHDDRRPSFSMNIQNGMWLCFSCGLKGDLKYFLKLSGVAPSIANSMLEPIQHELETYRRREAAERRTKFQKDPFVGEVILPESLLGVYYYKPLAMVKAGFKADILKEYEIGYDRNKERIIFPIRDVYGNLVGVSGRTTKSSYKSRYKVYRGGFVDKDGNVVSGDFGKNFDDEFPNFKLKSHKYLWNAHNVYPFIEMDTLGCLPVIVTEGFKACLWVIQNGFKTTVATMGVSISEDQFNVLIRMAGNPIILFFDNDEAGRKATSREGKKLSKLVNDLYVAKYPDGYLGKSPDDLNCLEIKEAIYKSEDWRKWHLMQTSRKP